MNLYMDNKLAEIAALWAEWKFALMEQRGASFEQTALRARNRRAQIERQIVATPASTPLGGLIKLAIHEFNAEEAASISSTYRALAAIVGRDPLAEAREMVSHLANSKPLESDLTRDAPRAKQ
jgi:hypothetical protein